jgi:uncharacterized membrane protein YeaQ/YmgE (transglycosylase-associated protein family)
MSWLSWIVVGFIAGAFAKGVTGVRGAGCIGTVLIGIAGGILGGIVFKAAGSEGVNSFSLYSLLVAFVGASLLLFVYGLVAGHEHSR